MEKGLIGKKTEGERSRLEKSLEVDRMLVLEGAVFILCSYYNRSICNALVYKRY